MALDQYPPRAGTTEARLLAPLRRGVFSFLLLGFAIGMVYAYAAFWDFLRESYIERQRLEPIHITVKKRPPVDECDHVKGRQVDKWMQCKGYK